MKPIYPVRSRQVAARSFDGEMMIMSTSDSVLFSLDDIGSVIWQAADGKTSLAEIVEREVCTRFEVTPEVALPDAEEFVRELEQHGILRLCEEPVTGNES